MNDRSPHEGSCRLIPLLELVSLVEHALEESGHVKQVHLVLPTPGRPGAAQGGSAPQSPASW